MDIIPIPIKLFPVIRSYIICGNIDNANMHIKNVTSLKIGRRMMHDSLLMMDFILFIYVV